MKTSFLIGPDRISGRGGSIPLETLGISGEEWGEEYFVEDMEGTRGMGGSTGQGSGIKRAWDVMPCSSLVQSYLLGNDIPGFD